MQACHYADYGGDLPAKADLAVLPACETPNILSWGAGRRTGGNVRACLVVLGRHGRENEGQAGQEGLGCLLALYLALLPSAFAATLAFSALPGTMRAGARRKRAAGSALKRGRGFAAPRGEPSLSHACYHYMHIFL